MQEITSCSTLLFGVEAYGNDPEHSVVESLTRSTLKFVSVGDTTGTVQQCSEDPHDTISTTVYACTLCVQAYTQTIAKVM